MLRLILLGLMVAAPFATYGAMKVREKIVVAAAVDGERDAGLNRCKAQITLLESTHNNQVETKAAEASAAADGVVTPESKAELIEICKRSSSCRERGKL